MAVRQAALVSDESALEACACSRRCAIQIDDLYLFLARLMLIMVVMVADVYRVG